MRIGIDARFYGSIGKGLGRYTQRLVEHLEEIDTENSYYIFLRRENFDEYQPKNANFKKVLADYAWYSFAEQFFFPALLFSFKLDLMHFPHFNVPILYFKRFIITIHDLILLHFPTKRASTLQPLVYWIKFRAYKLVIFLGIVRSEKIITVSQFTKNDILSQYNVDEKKIVVTSEACGEFEIEKAITPAQILEKYAIIKPYLLYVGNAYPHKNLEKLIAAFCEICKEKKDLSLVLVGKDDYFYDRLKQQVEENKIANVIFPGFIDDLHLNAVYAQAELYVFPSLYEGFGLPPLEAMKNGSAVVSSDSTCLPEILGDAAYFVDTSDEDKIATGVLAVLSDDNLRKKLIEKGYLQVGKYDWKVMAKETLAVYQNAIKKKQT
ncbi:MAG: glycosyltransferase family 1 protein [bacterium]